jgi:uridine kinase
MDDLDDLDDDLPAICEQATLSVTAFGKAGVRLAYTGAQAGAIPEACCSAAWVEPPLLPSHAELFREEEWVMVVKPFGDVVPREALWRARLPSGHATQDVQLNPPPPPPPPAATPNELARGKARDALCERDVPSPPTSPPPPGASPAAPRAVVYGITGATRSGKSRVAKLLRARLAERGHDVKVVGQDSFWVRPVRLTLPDGSAAVSEEEPACTDNAAFARAITAARTAVAATQPAAPPGVVLAEGFQLLHAPEVAALVSRAIVIDSDRDECCARRCAPRGPHNPNPLPRRKFDGVVWPAHERYVASAVEPLVEERRVRRLGPLHAEEQYGAAADSAAAEIDSVSRAHCEEPEANTD